jgi:transposase
MNNSADISPFFKTNGPCRTQVEFQFESLDSLLPKDHRARDIWTFVDAMDHTVCFNDIKTLNLQAGRSTTCPKILLAVWIYSILDGNASARKLDELCKNHLVYKWIVGGVEINRTMLASFRSRSPRKFEDLLTSCLAGMVKADLIHDRDFSQDGSRMKANAGFASFRGRSSLEEIQKDIGQHIKEVTQQKNHNKREAGLLLDKQKRIDKAIAALEGQQLRKEANGKKHRQPPKKEDLEKVKASTSDPECIKMKMGDGGYRLAYNVQFATGVDSRVIFGVDVVNTPDPGAAPKMMKTVHDRCAVLDIPAPQGWLTDSAYSSKDDVEAAAILFPECDYISPAKVRKSCDAKKHQRGDSEAVRNWRDLLDDPDRNERYKKRCSTAEFSNAQVKNKGFTSFSVRGAIKAKGQALLHAIANNIERFLDLSKKRVTEVVTG